MHVGGWLEKLGEGPPGSTTLTQKSSAGSRKDRFPPTRLDAPAAIGSTSLALDAADPTQGSPGRHEGGLRE
jgi:hypothetical protein